MANDTRAPGARASEAAAREAGAPGPGAGSGAAEEPRAQARVLVASGTGKTGRRVAARLAGARIGTRNPAGRDAVAFDWSRPESWGPALDGVEAAYLAYYPDITAPEAADALGAFARLAAARGVRRLVLLSGRGMEGAAAAERAVREAGTGWTVLRASWFAQNFSEEFLVHEVRAGEFTLPAVPGLVEPFVDAEDIADVAAAALTAPDGAHAGRVYELTGPRALSLEEAAARISAAAGREVRYRPSAPGAYAGLLAAQGLPPEVAGLLSELFSQVLDGRNAAPTGDVEAVLGRPAREFTAYARAAAAAGAWS
ncbi:NmrA family NAD(P)-binding protein [Streptomyces hoynatensis]|uniref:NmrA family transcriptional regulator n=1 Tax=Streptomyces hoynatensis TaxID=1141874 RepID=A0A3A9ZB90_9ACTN|nr:NmrA family NAD(P)-binding protein [Streptomyces hoynatensis]RKN45722.1 NmrA family transcriptional regulator [Streptomyces hoynatensis]